MIVTDRARPLDPHSYAGVQVDAGGKVVTMMVRRAQVDADSTLGRAILAATACPACQSELGLPCVDQLGEPLNVIHGARADVFDDGLLTAVGEMAGIAARATEERDALIVRAVEAGLSTRQVGTAAGLTHTAVQYIVKNA